MESLYKLKHAKTQFKRIVIAHDITKKEREECKKLAEDAKMMGAQDALGNICTGFEASQGK